MIATQTACATPSEPGIPGFAIFADHDDDGRRDGNEPFTVTGRPSSVSRRSIVRSCFHTFGWR